MLIGMVVIFAICWLPLNVVHIAEELYTKDFRHYKFFFLSTHVIAMSSTIYNPFLYSWLNDNFRKEFQKIVPCLFKLCWCFNRRQVNNPSTQVSNFPDGEMYDRPSTHHMPGETTTTQVKSSTSNGKLNSLPMKKLTNPDVYLPSPIEETKDALLTTTNHI